MMVGNWILFFCEEKPFRELLGEESYYPIYVYKGHSYLFCLVKSLFGDELKTQRFFGKFFLSSRQMLKVAGNTVVAMKMVTGVRFGCILKGQLRGHVGC
jgi:hypothetical protein